MRLSQTAEYALRAVLDIADRGGDAAVPVATIAEDLSVPRNYLSKILHQLAKAGVLVSSRGPGGGFRLRDDPSRITLAEVVDPVDPIAEDSRCLLGKGVCSSDSPCAVHERWCSISEQVRTFFFETSLADMVNQHRGLSRGSNTPERK